jgi:hypothetical protein
MVHKLFILLLFSWVLVGCGTQDNPGNSEDAATVRTVERYLQAKIDADETTIRELICAEMERNIPREAASFAGVTNKRLEDMSCQRNAGANTVTCTGMIVANYGAEDTTFPLATYRVVQEDGDWKWCGEAG